MAAQNIVGPAISIAPTKKVKMSGKYDDSRTDMNSLEHLSNLLKAAEEKGKRLAEESRKLTQSGQYIADLADATKSAIRFVRPRNVEFLITDWEVVNSQEDQALAHITKVSIASVNSTAGTAAFAIGSYFDPNMILPHVPESEQAVAQQSIMTLRYVVNRAADEQEVVSLMNQFGLNRAPKGKKSATSLFGTAHKAFESPVSSDNPVSTSLIPLREAVRVTIDELLKRRPVQKETKTEVAKISSIGGQLKRDTIPQETVESWAQQWSELLDRHLSTAKEQDISRAEWQFRLQQATLFLKAFLGGLDPEKVNRKRRRMS